MKKIAVAVIAALLGTPALAAEPVYSWTGFYVGANAGFSFGRDPSTITDASLGQALESFNALPDGPIGGGQIGYNWQFAPNWVLGFEGDFQGQLRTIDFASAPVAPTPKTLSISPTSRICSGLQPRGRASATLAAPGFGT